MEDYRAKQNKGETLNEEQLKAVAKLDDVLSQIDLLQDLIKQFNTHSADVSWLTKFSVSAMDTLISIESKEYVLNPDSCDNVN